MKAGFGNDAKGMTEDIPNLWKGAMTTEVVSINTSLSSKLHVHTSAEDRYNRSYMGGRGQGSVGILTSVNQ